MRNSGRRLQVAAILFFTLCLWTTAFGQITPSADAYTNNASPTTNYGSASTLGVVSPSQTTYVQFDLSSIPTGYSSANVAKASLKLYVNTVATAGSFNVDFVNGTWSEKTITANLSPALGTTVAASVPLTTANAHDYILIDVTSAVGDWLNGTQANDGIALVGNSPFSATFDSKENTTQSHPPELDIVFTGGGTITGVKTASGSGLIGGGTSGTLNLALTNACATNQVLQWNGTSWVCAGVGTGTVTSVGSGLGLSGGPITGSGTLSMNPSVVPQLNAANTFTGNQTVNGNLSATGLVTGSSFQIGSNLFAFGSYENNNAFLGFSGNTATTGQANTASGWGALASITIGYLNVGNGTQALSFNTDGVYNTANGAEALYTNTSGNYNTATGDRALWYNTTGNFNTASGQAALINNTNGIENTASGTQALINNTTGSFNTGLGSQANVGSGNLTNATAIGAYAQVNNSNALVLGSINGVNGATADTYVGIGTTAPTNPLTVVSSSNYIPVQVQGPSTFGTWLALSNTSTGGQTWNFLSAGSGNSEGAGNLGITNLHGGTIYLEGNVNVSGNLSKGGGSFKIDHPLDPANKYLSHSFVESPDMMNVYNGNVVTDRRGLATIVMPEYFDALNSDFRYQLTVIGQFAQAIVAKEIKANHFTIKTNKPGVKVSWQVTGIRHDAWANAHRIPVEEDKPPQEQGHYLHPELFGASEEQAVGSRPPSPSTEAGRTQVAANRKQADQ